jgi:hypothetical protein
MLQSYILSTLPDLLDGDLEENLDRIQGLGATGMTLLVTTPARMHLRGDARCQPRILRTRGGYFFQPDRQHYTEAHVQPVVSSWGALAPVAGPGGGRLPHPRIGGSLSGQPARDWPSGGEVPGTRR